MGVRLSEDDDVLPDHHNDVDDTHSHSHDHDDDADHIDRRAAAVMDLHGNIVPPNLRAAIHSVLAALYVRHGSIAITALDGLEKLLKETNFFENDLGLSFPPEGCVTMIELVVDVSASTSRSCFSFLLLHSTVQYIPIVFEQLLAHFSELFLSLEMVLLSQS